MPTCQNCGGHVSSEFTRVFCQTENEPQACPQCVSSRQIFEGAAENRKRGWESRKHSGEEVTQ